MFKFFMLTYVATKKYVYLVDFPNYYYLQTPRPCSEFLCKFVDFISNQINPEDPLRTVVVSILNPVGVNQNIMGPTHK